MSYFSVSRTFFYTISPHDISFLIIESMSNRVNRLFFSTAFRYAVTFNFLRTVVIVVYSKDECVYVHGSEGVRDTRGELVRVYTRGHDTECVGHSINSADQ